VNGPARGHLDGNVSSTDQGDCATGAPNLPGRYESVSRSYSGTCVSISASSKAGCRVDIFSSGAACMRVATCTKHGAGTGTHAGVDILLPLHSHGAQQLLTSESNRKAGQENRQGAATEMFGIKNQRYGKARGEEDGSWGWRRSYPSRVGER
jgi:hypothetical protein